jgi:hypothetical protein
MAQPLSADNLKSGRVLRSETRRCAPLAPAQTIASIDLILSSPPAGVDPLCMCRFGKD